MIDATVLDLRSVESADDKRRRSLAALHCEGVDADILCVHAVALARDGVGVLLLGGHGAGKSLTGLAMSERGWQVVAGDIALVKVGRAASAPVLIGGTREFLVRPAAYRHWFSGRPVGPVRGTGSGERLELGAALTWVPLPVTGFTVRSAVEVAVGAGPGIGLRESDLDGHTSASVWYRASSHLLDRVLDDENAKPLRSLENHKLAAKRMALVRVAARALPVRWISGTPTAIARMVEASLMQTCRG